MFNFLKRKKDKKQQGQPKEQLLETVEPSQPPLDEAQPPVNSETEVTTHQPQPPVAAEQSTLVQSADISNEITLPEAKQELNPPKKEEKPAKPSLFKKLSHSLTKTRHSFTSGLANIFLGKKELDEELLEEIENQLITADIGIEAAEMLIEDLTKAISRKEIKDSQMVLNRLKDGLYQIIQPCQQPLVVDNTKLPYVVLMIGVNGSGKTTTIGKLAKKFKDEGKSVMLAAGDTFRAAAIEQLKIWGERNDVPVISQHTGADSASVAFDALSSAKAKQIDVLLIDTAGRLHTADNLMEELKKVKRVLSKQEMGAPHEVMLVLDAGIGQNALLQADKFNQAIGLNSITLTKLDGTAKGGIIFAIAKKLKLPIRFIGCGEKIEDLKEFNAQEFIDALFTREGDE